MSPGSSWAQSIIWVLWFKPLAASWGLQRTDLREPPGDAAVHLVQDDDDHQVDDDGGGGDGDADTRAPRGRGADGQGGGRGDPVDDHSEHDGERQPDLRGRTTQNLTKDLPLNALGFRNNLKNGTSGPQPKPPQFCIKALMNCGKGSSFVTWKSHEKKWHHDATITGKRLFFSKAPKCKLLA